MMLIDKKKTIDVLMAEYRECSKDADEMGGEAVLLADGIDSAIDIVRRMPTIDPVKHGRWIGEGDGYADGEMVIDVWHCSNCDYCIDEGIIDPDSLPNYCPVCGAKMDANE